MRNRYRNRHVRDPLGQGQRVRIWDGTFSSILFAFIFGLDPLFNVAGGLIENVDAGCTNRISPLPFRWFHVGWKFFLPVLAINKI